MKELHKNIVFNDQEFRNLTYHEATLHVTNSNGQSEVIEFLVYEAELPIRNEKREGYEVFIS